MVSEKTVEYDIQVAIHNHGPEDEVYPTPQSIYEKIQGLDARLGLCVDIGHTRRAGVDPAATVRELRERVHDVHIKDVNRAKADGEARLKSAAV
ncbi:MAG: TIM barrel protein [candidate division KSB1 bacterium]|nr:TIM barrel protein [candidate division KSB1 bacterium]